MKRGFATDLVALVFGAMSMIALHVALNPSDQHADVSVFLSRGMAAITYALLAVGMMIRAGLQDLKDRG